MGQLTFSSYCSLVNRSIWTVTAEKACFCDVSIVLAPCDSVQRNTAGKGSRRLEALHMLWDPCGDEAICERTLLMTKLTKKVTQTELCDTREVLRDRNRHCYRKISYEATLC